MGNKHRPVSIRLSVARHDKAAGACSSSSMCCFEPPRSPRSQIPTESSVSVSRGRPSMRRSPMRAVCGKRRDARCPRAIWANSKRWPTPCSRQRKRAAPGVASQRWGSRVGAESTPRRRKRHTLPAYVVAAEEFAYTEITQHVDGVAPPRDGLPRVQSAPVRRPFARHRGLRSGARRRRFRLVLNLGPISRCSRDNALPVGQACIRPGVSGHRSATMRATAVHRAGTAARPGTCMG